jgi:2'-5' RNA ligase
MLPVESSLMIVVPEAERLVKPFREKYDPSAAVGVPAHITLLYPFKPPVEINKTVLDNLNQCFAHFQPFAFFLTATRRFGVRTLYLAPEPDEPFRELTMAIWACHPETPPDEGRYSDVVPHLSIADQCPDDQQLESIAVEFAYASRGELPIGARATEVTLMDTTSGRWEIRTKLRLG